MSDPKRRPTAVAVQVDDGDPPLKLEEDCKAIIVSDLHIGDGTPSEPFRRKDQSFRDFLDHTGRNADALIIAGDFFDLGQAWSLKRIFAAHERMLSELVALSRRIPVFYLFGNHDDSLRESSLIPRFNYGSRLTIGGRFLVEHGHGFDPLNRPGNRVGAWGSWVHSQLERLLRSPLRIPMWKHDYWSTRLGHWLLFRYGKLVELQANIYRAAGRNEQADKCFAFLDYWGSGEWGNPFGLVENVETFLRNSPFEAVVCGHSHQPGRVQLDGGIYVNSGSWTFDESSFVEYDHGRFTVKTWPDGRVIEDDEYRGFLGPNRHKGFFDWWNQHYRGWLRYDVDSMKRVAYGKDPR